MKTTRDILRNSDNNMGWCKPYIGERVAFALVEGKVEALRVDGAELDATEENLFRACLVANPDADSYHGWSPAHILIDGDVAETSCANCPWFDICSVMDEPIEGTETTGDLIRARRNAAGLKQSELAAMIGCSQKDVSRWENGEHEPSIGNLKKIAAALGCSIDDLV